MIQHKHMLVNAKLSQPMSSEIDAVEFLENLVKRINMKILMGPFAVYLQEKGNRGLTAIVMIETSHIAFHIWDELDPALLQFDLYTCGEMNVSEVLEALREAFTIVSMEYQVIDREDGFFLEQYGMI